MLKQHFEHDLFVFADSLPFERALFDLACVVEVRAYCLRHLLDSLHLQFTVNELARERQRLRNPSV